MRKPGEPIYRRGHLIALLLAVGLPIVALQIYRMYVGPISFGMLLGLIILASVLSGTFLYFMFRSSCQNQP